MKKQEWASRGDWKQQRFANEGFVAIEATAQIGRAHYSSWLTSSRVGGHATPGAKWLSVAQKSSVQNRHHSLKATETEKGNWMLDVLADGQCIQKCRPLKVEQQMQDGRQVNVRGSKSGAEKVAARQVSGKGD